jgi:protein-disulfide isomerase
VFLENQKRGQAVNAYAKNLEPKYNVKVYLGAPQIPLVQVPLAGIPSIGPADAPVTVVEFSDYECPACRGAHETVKRVRAEYGNKLRWYFQDYPLRQHKHAFKAAEAAHCAADHGKFWEYQNVVFTRDKLDPEDLVKYAAELGIPAETFRACLQAEKHKATVEQNLRDATVSGVDRTPSFIINGQLLTGALSFEAFKAKIEAELQRAGKP